MPALPAINNLRTALASALGVADLAVQVISTAGWPNAGVISVDTEIIAYTGKTVNTFTGLTRGYDGTANATHQSGVNCSLRIVAKHLNDAAFIKNAPMPISVGGLPAGSVFPERLSVQEMLEKILYPYQAPAFTLIAIAGQTAPFEVGHTVPQNVTFNWTISNPSNLQPNSLSITDVTGSSHVLASGLSNFGSQAVVLAGPIQKIAAGSHQFRMDGVNSLAQPFTGDLVLSWLWKLFYGVSANAMLTGPQIGTLAAGLLTGGYSRTYPMDAGGYKFICLADAAGGQINAVKDLMTGFNMPMADVSDGFTSIDGGGFAYNVVNFTNVFGVTTPYRVYRTKNFLGGALSLVVT